jgi:DNA recombination-dependent growth factor C
MPRKVKKPKENHRVSLSETVRTPTIRLDDDLLLLIQESAKRDKTLTADIIRDAMTRYVDRRAQNDPRFALEVLAAAQKRHERALAEISQTLGPFAAASVNKVAPLSSPPAET